MPEAPASAMLRDIAVRLRAVGDGALLTPLRREIRAEAKPLVDAVAQAARDQLPHTGGLNDWVANQHFTISVLAGARTAGVRLAGPRGIRSGGQTNRGYVRHPRFGDRDQWYTEQIPQAAGWWTNTLRARSGAVTPRIVAVINRVNAWVQGRGV